MEPERWRRVKEVFLAVQESHEDAAVLLCEMTADDVSLRADVERLLKHQTNDGDDFLESPQFSLSPFRTDIPVFEPGQVLGRRWRIEQLLASGGMGEVYEAFDSELEETVALKTIRGRLADDPAALDRFRREIRIARKIGHPNICKVYDLFTHTGEDGVPVRFVTMELLPGETLAHRLEYGPVDGRLALMWAREMVEGLAAAHEAGIVHSDFKSSNIMLVPRADGTSRIVITDFGLARNFSPEDGDFAAAEPAGTPGYMAPEQWTGSGVSFATDIYSLGVVLYEMLTGAPPFPPALSSSVLRKQQTVPALKTAALRPALDPRWQRIIERCLEPDPARRPPRVSNLLAEFDAKPLLGRKAMAFGIALLVCVIAFATYFYSRVQDGGYGNSVVVLPFQTDGQSPEVAYAGAGLTDELIGALSRAPEIRVIARETAGNYPAQTDVAELGRKLHVDRVVRGRVYGANGEILVSVEMIQPQTRVVMWAQQFRRPAQDVFGLHEQVRAALIGALRPASAEARRVPAHVPDSRAYRLYLEGQYFLQNRQRDLALAQKAADDFRKAIEADPQYADPYVGLAECTDILSGMPNTSYEQLHAEQREAAAQALRLDPDSPAALAAQASIFQHLDYNWTLAEQYLRRAVKMQPGNARLHQLYAGLLSDIGKQDEALAEFQQALDLDPDSPSTVVAREICLYRARRYADAKAQIEATLRKEPALFRLYSYLAAIYLQQGDCSAALENYRKAVDLAKGDPLSLAHEAYGLASCRDTDKAKQIVNALQRGNGNFFYIACALGAMRDYDAAFATLDKAVAEHDNDLTLLRVHPYADNLRRDPRVHKYLKIVHLE